MGAVRWKEGVGKYWKAMEFCCTLQNLHRIQCTSSLFQYLSKDTQFAFSTPKLAATLDRSHAYMFLLLFPL